MWFFWGTLYLFSLRVKNKMGVEPTTNHLQCTTCNMRCARFEEDTRRDGEEGHKVDEITQRS